MKIPPPPLLLLRIAIWVVFAHFLFHPISLTAQVVTENDRKEVSVKNLIEKDTALPVKRALLGCDSISQSNPTRLDRRLTLAIQLSAYDFHESAIHILREIVEKDPTIHECYYRLGYSLELIGKVDEALIQFQRYLELEPEQAVTLYRIGELLNRNGEVESSNEHLFRYIERVPDCPAGNRRIGQNMIALNKPAEAIQPLKLVLEQFPRDRGTLTALSQAFLRSGQNEKTTPLQETLGKLRNGELIETPVSLVDPLLQSLNQLDKTPAFCVTAAAELEAKGLFASANVYLELAIEGTPESPVLFVQYGYNCAKLGQNDRALAAYRQSLQLNPEEESALYHRSFLFFGMGRLSEAENDLNTLLSLNPEHANGLTLKSKIETMRKRTENASPKEGK